MTIKITVEVDEDQLQDWMINELKQSYIDQVTYWNKDKNFEKLSDALLEVIQYYSIPNEYQEWYETIKEL